MKRFLLRTLALLGFAIVSYILLIIIFGSLAPVYLTKNLNYKIGSYGHLYSRLQDADTTKNVDILVLGSSHSYRGYDPRIFAQNGFKIFVMGSSAQTPVQTELLVDRYLDQMNPRLVIFDVYPALLGNEGVESSLDLIANGSIDKNTFQMACAINNIKIYNTLIYGTFRQTFGLNKNFRELQEKDGDTYIKGGYVETYRQYKPKGEVKESRYTILPDQLKAYNRIIEKLKSKNKKYILIQTPMTGKRYNSYQNNDEMDSLFTQKGRYYNFNNRLSLPDSVFFDEGHLNQKGVNIYNEKIVEILKTEYKF